MRKKVFITGGLIALMLLISSSTAFAQSLQLSQDQISSIKTEISAGKPLQDVLKENGITMDKIRAALGGTVGASGHVKLSNTQIATIATKLGLDPAEVQAEIASGESFEQIIQAHHITLDQITSLIQPPDSQ